MKLEENAKESLSSEPNGASPKFFIFRADITIRESPSKTASVTSKSLANSRALVAAKASISSGQSYCGIRTAMEAKASPLSSRITTPNLEQFSSARMAPSKLILSVPWSGGFHLTLLIGLLGGVPFLALKTQQNSQEPTGEFDVGGGGLGGSKPGSFGAKWTRY